MRKRSIVLPITLAVFLWSILLASADGAFAATEALTQMGVPQQQATPTPKPEDQATSSPNRRPATQGVASTSALTTSIPLTSATDITVTVPLSDDQEALLPTPTPDSTDDSTSGTVVVEGVLEGTIVANRTDATIRFFVEGQLFTLDPRRSTGLDLPRASAVLNLFNCDAGTPETQEGCYWDPYLLQRDAFYEIVTGEEGGESVNLMLREAGSPEADQIWIQNRTGKIEVVVYRSETFELAPSSVNEFAVDTDEMPTFFLRSCVEANGEAACEWLPVVAEAGVYYSLALIETVGGLPNSTVSMLELRPVLTGNGVDAAGTGTGTAQESEATAVAADASETPAVEPAAAPPSAQFLCTLLVPALNVRSGSGLEYEIVAKIRGTETEPATVLVTGRNAAGDWLAVDERVARGGWITSSTSFIACDGDLATLPETEITDGRLAPTPAPVAQPAGEEPVAESGDAAPEGEATAEGADAESTPQVTAPPDGLALLVVNNAFDHELRFTLDARYRVEPAPSEIDLQPGESTSIVVYPDFIPISVSSAWNSMSGNADFYLEADETRVLWLIFIPDPDGSGRWILQF
jgi:hypothetical protein